NPPGVVHRHDGDIGRAEAEGGLDLGEGEAGGAVAAEEQDGPVRPRQARGGGAGEAPADHAADPAGEPLLRMALPEEHVRPAPDVAAVEAEGDVLVQERLDLADEAEGRDRNPVFAPVRLPFAEESLSHTP